ncbi:hypothetical protein RDABS01_015592 [Bienertia sinuspersici]
MKQDIKKKIPMRQVGACQNGRNSKKKIEEIHISEEYIKRPFRGEKKELQSKLRAAHEETNTAHNDGVVKALRSKMNEDVSQTLKRQ